MQRQLAIRAQISKAVLGRRKLFLLTLEDQLEHHPLADQSQIAISRLKASLEQLKSQHTLLFLELKQILQEDQRSREAGSNLSANVEAPRLAETQPLPLAPAVEKVSLEGKEDSDHSVESEASLVKESVLSEDERISPTAEVVQPERENTLNSATQPANRSKKEFTEQPTKPPIDSEKEKFFCYSAVQSYRESCSGNSINLNSYIEQRGSSFLPRPPLQRKEHPWRSSSSRSEYSAYRRKRNSPSDSRSDAYYSSWN